MSVIDFYRYNNITSFNTTYLLDYNGVSTLVNEIRSQNILSNAFYGELTNWLISLMYFPIRIRFSEDTEYYLKLGNVDTEVKCTALSQYISKTYYLGSAECEAIIEKNYKYLEPFCSCEMYLPYYGKCDIPMSYFHSFKYLSFYLSIDIISGGAKYTITASNAIPVPKSGQETNARKYRNIGQYDLPVYDELISEYPFQLGYEVPINNTGEASKRTATAIAALSAISSVVTGSVMFGGAIAASSQKINKFKANKPGHKGAKQNRKYNAQLQELKHSELSDVSESAVSFANSSVQSACRVLDSMELKGTSNNVSNPAMYNNNTKEILIYIKRKQVKDLEPKLFGKPYGKYVRLDTLNGYATIGNIIFESFQGTQEELIEIKSLLSQGIIF